MALPRHARGGSATPFSDADVAAPFAGRRGWPSKDPDDDR